MTFSPRLKLDTNAVVCLRFYLQIKVKSGSEEGWVWSRLVAADEDLGHEVQTGE